MATAIALAISAVPYRARNISPEDRVVWRRDILRLGLDWRYAALALLDVSFLR